MTKVHSRRCVIFTAVLAALALVVWAGCSKDLISPDEYPPEDSSITNPLNMSSLNNETINVRGRAEVGATIDVFVTDASSGVEVFGGTAFSSPAIPDDGLGGRFTVEEVSLGVEGMKILRAKITDLYGNVASGTETPMVTIFLDQTPPPIAFEGIEGAEWVDTLGFWGDGFWESGLPSVTVSGSTDTSALGARLRVGIDQHVASELVADTLSSVVNFAIEVPSPPLTGGHADTLINYFLESFDAAGNVNAEPLFLHWEVEGKEEELSQDDGVYNNHAHAIALRPGEMVAVRYQAPTWANYVTKLIFYNANDYVDHPTDPQGATSKQFTAWIWHTTVPDSMPGVPGNEGYTPFSEPGMYPEDAWVEITFPNAIDITDNSHYPNKTFFIGIEWEFRENPRIYEDHSEPIALKSFYFDLIAWNLRDVDTMIRAVVSDVPFLDGTGREAVLVPVPVRVPR